MSDFQLGILALGAVVIGAVFGYNWFQERRYRQQTKTAFEREHPDVLLDVPGRDGKGERLEPALDDDMPNPLDPAPHKESAGSTQADTLIRYAQANPASEAAPDVADMTEMSEDELDQSLSSIEQQLLIATLLDPMLDFIAEVRFEQPVTLPRLPSFAIDKRVEMLGNNPDSGWERARANRSYSQLNIGVQMVDRRGPLNESELNAFCSQAQDFAEQHGSNASFPQRQTRLTAARELDQFCAGVDVMIGLNLLAAAPFDGERLRALAESAGMQLEADGHFHYLSDSGNVLFMLGNANGQPFSQDSLAHDDFSALTLLFDVPRVAGGISVFDRAVALARQLAGELDAQLIDDNQRPLTESGINTIRHQLQQLYSRMDDRGIAPGSVAALRLFA
ncbi:MAG: cell division protein ZipA C-terminal FtsZ-binding domain-containing protein [Rivihabitans pingtungensis]|uniref:cell division protein ZipA C-terminal FtsZ-binding domain-containing protein n=1 Tax=Rivihabitans pingtungensis TaxID=1054498 RepID=UPI00289A6FD1|nr:cell division protein ZipA C-terminal FtsZ-binding domain-containing protein [Rivihabitans pingtungensis]